LPLHRNYLVTAGLEQALDFLENVHFPGDEISYIRSLRSLAMSVPTSSTISCNSPSPAFHNFRTAGPHPDRRCSVRGNNGPGARAYLRAGNWMAQKASGVNASV